VWIKGDIKFFRKKLLIWFQHNRRDYPWRAEGATNYELIFSEILLQRTRADTVAKNYNTFFHKFPGWEALVHATNCDLEAVFRPLGLHTQRVARVRRIIDGYIANKEILPRNTNELHESGFASLYLSNAYELFVLKRRAPLLDVNMWRVLSRFFSPRELMDIRKDKLIQGLAREVINVKACKELNWAILDFGALICKARAPGCLSCPLKKKCRLLNSHAV